MLFNVVEDWRLMFFRRCFSQLGDMQYCNFMWHDSSSVTRLRSAVLFLSSNDWNRSMARHWYLLPETASLSYSKG